MKNFIKSVVYFSIFLVVTYPMLIVFWGSFAPQRLKPNINYPIGGYGHMYSRIKDLENTANVDVLFLGSSHAYRGFDVRIFEGEGLKVFNLGSSNQTPIQTVVLLKKYLDKLNPKVIIIEVCHREFESDGVEGSIDIIANDRNGINTTIMALKINHVKTYNALIYGFMRDIFNANNSFREPKQKGNDTYISGGYVEKELAYYSHVKRPTKIRKFNGKQFVAFEEIVSMINKRDIEFILVYASVTSSLYESYANNDTFDDKMREFGLYYNFNLIMELDDSLHFYDSHHLNQVGVTLFNKKVLEIIRTKLPNNP